MAVVAILLLGSDTFVRRPAFSYMHVPPRVPAPGPRPEEQTYVESRAIAKSEDRARAGAGGTLGKLKEVPTENSALQPMIARSASLSIITKDFAAARASLESIVSRHNGYSAQLDPSIHAVDAKMAAHILDCYLPLNLP